MKKFTFYKQLFETDCGPTCLMMIAKSYGKTISLQSLRDKSQNNRAGVTLVGLSDAAEAIGFRTLSAKTQFDKLREHFPLPCIAYWRKKHFIVIYDFTKTHVCVADPAHGLLKYTFDEFKAGWLNTKVNSESTGIVLVLEPTPEFYKNTNEIIDRSNWSFVFTYLKPYKKHFFQLALGMLIGTLLMLILPFLTQAIVDIGINTRNIGFINLILFAQLTLTIGQTGVDFIRSWILLHISSRLNISILSDFFIKLMKLPISFFETKMTGDILQRISDHKRIETFLSSTSLNFLFSVINLLIFSLVLVYYSLKIFVVFMLGSAVYVFWVSFFLKKRREFDYKMFDQMSLSQTNIIQLITGMQEIKLHNSEKIKRWEWERIQAKQFRINQSSLVLSQYEQAGTVLINQIKNIVLTYLTAKAVINGEITFGIMLSIQYIIGQVNAPIGQLVGFIHTFQAAKISLDRLSEIHNLPDEEDDNEQKVHIFPKDSSITFENVSFYYTGGEKVLQNIDLHIPQYKTTAIVGHSGSGKTTLIKLLLKFYESQEGKVKIGNINFKNISVKDWRNKCGSVLQDGFIFSDTIARNIAVSDENINWTQLEYAAKTANIESFIDTLPLGYETKIGVEGQGLSQGQKQRILIARAVYKNPDFIFFDEATNALDANNEKQIMDNLDIFLRGKTVVVVAHRLSTVAKADQIIVLEKGKIIEQGTHHSLIQSKGTYYQLIKNQLELGS